MSVWQPADEIPTDAVDLRPGDRMSSWTMGPFTRTDFVRYAGAAGDLNPIHHDETFATSAGMPSVFAMGMLHAGVLGNRLARWVGPGNIRTFSVRFVGRVWPGDTLTFDGRVGSVEHGLAHLELRVERGDHEAVLIAASQAEVRRAER